MIAAWMWIGLALAVPPDRAASVLDIDGGSISNLQASADGRIVVGRAGNELILLDADSWLVVKSDACEVVAAYAEPAATEGDYDVYMACNSGSVYRMFWSQDTLRPAVNSAGEEVVFEPTTRQIRGIFPGQGATELIVLADGEPPPTNGGDGGGGTPAQTPPYEAHLLDIGSGAVNESTGYPIPLAVHSGFSQAVLRRGAAGNQIIIAHSGSNFTTLTVGSTQPLSSQMLGGIQVSPTHIAPNLNGGVWIADSNGTLAQYTGASGPGSIIVQDNSLDSPSAVVQAFDPTDGGWVLVRDGSEILVFDPVGSDPVDSFPSEVAVADMVEGPAGYVIGGGTGGRMVVYTARPWVGAVDVEPQEGTQGDEVTVRFTLDEPGNYTLHFGGDRTGSGRELGRGSVVPGEETTVTFTVDQDFDEGVNPLYVVFTRSGDGLTGHGRGAFLIDNPPRRIELSDSSLAFGNQTLALRFDRLTAPDIEHYMVYVDVNPFEPDDWPTGGPEFTGADEIVAPVQVAHPTSGRVDVRITPLTNGADYWVAVRATDRSGQEGPMSRVLMGSPRPTTGAADLGGDPDCDGCSGAGSAGRGLGLAALVLGVIAARRRRSAALAALLVGALLLPGDAMAVDDADDRRGIYFFGRDETPSWMSFEFKYGQARGLSDNTSRIYGPWLGYTGIEIGPQLFRVLEFDLGLGLYRRNGQSADDIGAGSGDGIRLEAMPLSLGTTGRLHIFDEQPIVPHIGVGIDIVFWREVGINADNMPDADTRVTGSKTGWHWKTGGAILLDHFAPRQASMLEATTGINDTWLIVEYRRQYFFGDGPALSGWSVSAGIKLDF